MYDSIPIHAGVYADYRRAGDLYTGALMSYSDDNGNLFTQGTGELDLLINIEYITGDIVRGTFSGTLKAEMQPDIAVTEGRFFLERSN